jgi:hypothetical protein
VTRHIFLDKPPDASVRIDGVQSPDRRPLPKLGKSVLLQVYGDRRHWWLARVCEVDPERHVYSVELITERTTKNESEPGTEPAVTLPGPIART